MDRPTQHITLENAQAALANPRALTPLILFMGFLGASLRYALELAFPAQGGFPWATLIINLFGCFVLEMLNNFIGKQFNIPGPLIKSLGVGLVGAFTTISAFSTECINLVLDTQYALVLVYVAATLVLSFCAAYAGHLCASAVSERRAARRPTQGGSK